MQTILTAVTQKLLEATLMTMNCASFETNAIGIYRNQHEVVKNQHHQTNFVYFFYSLVCLTPCENATDVIYFYFSNFSKYGLLITRQAKDVPHVRTIQWIHSWFQMYTKNTLPMIVDQACARDHMLDFWALYSAILISYLKRQRKIRFANVITWMALLISQQKELQKHIDRLRKPPES